MADRFLIAPLDTKSGMRTDFKPWLIPDEAFQILDNAYVFRGRVRKRFGSRWLGYDQFSSRLRIKLGTVAGDGNFSGHTPFNSSGDPIVPMAVGQSFSAGSVMFTVQATGVLVNLLRSDGLALPAAYTSTGYFTLVGDTTLAGKDVYFYPGLPVMGLKSLEITTTNDEPTIAFDTRFAYQYAGSGWEQITNVTAVGDNIWSGNDTDFFWTCNWTGDSPSDKVMFITNNNDAEPNHMRQLSSAGTFSTFYPRLSDLTANTIGSNLATARILVPFKNRLLAFNTYEYEESPAGVFTMVHYPYRLRYSQWGSPTDVQAWRQDIPGKGGALDAPTTESIVTVEFVRDRLIVYFERSTWEVAYTGNQIYPFTWNQLNTELGAESTFSIIPFDQVAIGVGNVGIMACNGANVQRIDQNIPQTVFDIHNVDGGVDRVYGIRDYTLEMVYWAFPSTTTNSIQPYPNKILVYNYKNGTWAMNDDSITCFGYFQPLLGANWNSTTIYWNSTVTWDTGNYQAKARQIIAGNQEGYTFVVDPDCTTNAPVLQITDLTITGTVITFTVINHNLRVDDYCYFQDLTGTGNITDLNAHIFPVLSNSLFPVDADHFSIDCGDIAGVYSGGGTISRVSSINIATKQYNFYLSEGRDAAVNKVDFLVDNTAFGSIQVQYYASSSLENLLADSYPYPLGNGALLGTSNLDTFPYIAVYPFEEYQDRLWHTVYIPANGQCIQLVLTMNDDQMRDVLIRSSDFQLHAMIFHAQKSSSRFG